MKGFVHRQTSKSVSVSSLAREGKLNGRRTKMVWVLLGAGIVLAAPFTWGTAQASTMISVTDKSIADWTNIGTVISDPLGDVNGAGPNDIIRMWVTNDSNNLYIRWDVTNTSSVASVAYDIAIASSASNAASGIRNAIAYVNFDSKEQITVATANSTTTNTLPSNYAEAVPMGTNTWAIEAKIPFAAFDGGTYGGQTYQPLLTNPINSTTIFPLWGQSLASGSWSSNAKDIVPDSGYLDYNPATGGSTAVGTGPVADVKVSAVNNSSYPGGTVSYKLTVTNTGDGTSNLTFNQITFALPNGFTYVPNSTAGFSVNNPSGTTGTLTWSGLSGSLASGQSSTLTFQANISSSEAVGTYYGDSSVTTSASKYPIDTGAVAPVTVGSAAPTGLQHTSVTSNGWTESWNPVGGATSYNVYVDGTKVGTTSTNSYDVTGESADTTYSVTVTAVNSGGESGHSNVDSVATLPHVPSAPTNLGHNNVSQTGWKETWDAVSGATSYNVYVDGTKVGTTSTNSYDVTGESADTSYSVTVTAVDSGGESSQSSADSVTTLANVPLAPMNLGHSNVSQTGWTEAWSSVKGAASYNVYINGIKKGTSFTNSYIVTGESADTTYSVTVTAVDSGGESLPSSADSVTTLANIPSAPTNLAHTNVSQTGWTENWDAVSGATAYNVYVDGTKVGTTSTNSYDVTGESADTTYSVTVTAVNSGGESSQSSADSVTTLADVPLAPTNLSHTNVSQTGWTENWDAVSGATSYNVYVDGAKVGTTSTNSYDVSGESENSTYSVTVTAVDSGGESLPSSADSVTTLANILSAPTNLAHTNVSQTGWTENWDAVSGATSYNVYVDGAKVGTTSTNSYDVTGESADTTYSVTVTAVNTGGESSQSSPDGVTTLADVPLAPINLSHKNVSQTGWKETWDAVSGATAYNVYVDGEKVGTTSTNSYDVSGESANTTYSVTVTAVDSGGESAKSIADSLITLANIPLAPTNLSHKNVSQTNWKETWDSVSGATSYNVYVDGAKVGTTSTNSYDVTVESADTNYSVTVTAVNNGGESSQSSADSVTTLADVPLAPMNLGHSNVSQTGWTEAWSSVKGAASYNVYINGSKKGTAYSNSYIVTGETAATTYSVTVTAVNTGGESAKSIADSVTTLPNVPAPPTGLSHSGVNTYGWMESWSPSSGATGYNVYVNNQKENTDPIGNTSYEVTGKQPNTQYTVAVTAVNAGGESAKSVSETVATSTQYLQVLQGSSYSVRFGTSQSASNKYSLVSGSLPHGLRLQPDGTLTGTPTTYGEFTFTVETQQNGVKHIKNVSMWVVPAAPTEVLKTIQQETIVDENGVTVGSSQGNGSATLDVPSGAYPKPVQVNLTTGSVPDSFIANNQEVVTDFGVNFNVNFPPAKPMTLTIHNPKIALHSQVYKISNGKLVPVQAAISPGKVVITFTNDPDFVVINPKQAPIAGATSPVTGKPFMWNYFLGAGSLLLGGGLLTFSRKKNRDNRFKGK